MHDSRAHFLGHSGAKAAHARGPLPPSTAIISMSRRNFVEGAQIAFGAALASGISAVLGVGAIGDTHHGDGGVACFLAGTRIQTASGPVAVEELRIGDAVLTVSGKVKPIKWIGKQEASSVAPVKIAKFSIDGTSPLRDLYVSPRHAVYIDGFLIPVIYLVNGTTIIREAKSKLSTYAYYHVEFETHEVILAEGLTVESYLAEASVPFSNGDEYLALYGPRTLPMAPFAPILSYSGKQQLASVARSALAYFYDIRRPLDKIRDRLADQAALAKAA